MKTISRNSIGLVSAILFCLTAINGLAILPPAREELPNLDRRPRGGAPAEADESVALAHLKTRTPDVSVSKGELFHAKCIHAERGFLTGPNGHGLGVSAATVAAFPSNETHLPTKAFVREHAALFGFGPEALEQARVKREFVTPHNGLQTVVWEQELEGIGIFDAVFISHTTKRGELVSVASQFIPAPAKAASARSRGLAASRRPPTIAAAQAIVFAARNIGEELELTGVSPVGAATADAGQKQLFKAAPLTGVAEARLLWLPLTADKLLLCWDVMLTSRVRGELYRLLVDVETGEVLIRHRLTEYISDASYRVFLSDSPSPFSPSCPTPCTTQPPVLAQTLVTLSAMDTNASPNGWIDDGINETRGNNVDAHTDRDDNDSPDLPRPQGSPFRTFDFVADLSQAPSTYTNAAVTDLFYWCNWMHDQLYGLGFTEAAGNFQNNNFGRGGLGNDALQADAQDGSGFNNANMSTPSDGSAPRMQMYVFTGPTPDRDGDFDHEIVLHEYTHGLSNRRVGGGVGLSASQSRGMGEGWSDWYGLALLSESGDDVNGVYAAGGYATYLFSGLTTNYYFGIRRYPYCTDLTKNPLTFRDIDPTQASAHTGIPRSPVIGNTADEVHNQGEVWCMTLWEARANLIGKYGHAIGNQLILQLVTDGMNLSPANPNFLQSRDAIMQADVVNNGGANLPELWAAFAKRGMGYSATSPSSSTTAGVVEAYDVPDSLNVTPGAGFTGIGPVGGPFSPNSTSLTLVNIGTNVVNWSASVTAIWLTLSQNSGVLAAGGSNQVTATVNPNANLLLAGVYNNIVRFTNVSSGVVHSRTFTLRVGQPDYFTELFDSGDNDLDNQTLTFTPDGSGNFYSVCREPALTFPTDPTGGTTIALGSHTYTTLNLASNISIYGINASTLYLASEGHVTLQAGDSSGSMTLANHFSRPRVSASLAHLHPNENGGAVSWLQLSNRVAITFNRVTEYGTFNTNSFQIELFYNGRIRMTHLQCATTSGLVGLSAGTGVPAGFVESDLSGYGGCALPMTVSGPTNVIEGGGAATGLVNIFAPAATNVIVTLSSSDNTEIITPTAVTILAGMTSTNFNFTIVDDAELDGVQPATISAAATGYAPASTVVTIADNETATLSLIAPAFVTEGAGSGSAIVQASAAPTKNIVVTLSSSDPTEIQVPATVILPAGQTNVGFSFTVVNDVQIDGPQPVTLTAQVSNWTDGLASVTVDDNEPTNLVVVLPTSAREGNGVLLSAGQVRIVGTLTTNLPVSLSSLDLTELLVPAVVTITAGQTNASFNLTIVDDPEIDSSQNVTVTAAAAGFAAGSAIMVISDNESPLEPFGPSPAHLATNVIQNSDLAWQSGAVAGEIITNDVYFGTTPAPGAAELLGTTTNTTWDLPLLAPQTSYYWQIVARKAGVTPGPVWQFTTRGLDHFTWDSLSSPQYVNEAFGVKITAKDAFETTVSNFTGTVNLTSSASGGLITNTLLPSPAPDISGSGFYTLAYAFTPATNLTVTHVRSCAGVKVSIWNNTGTLLASQNVIDTLGNWIDTPLASPLILLAGTTYRVSFYVNGGTYYYRTDRPATFPYGTIVPGYYYSTSDSFPATFYNSDTTIFLCDLRYTVGGLFDIPIQPAVSGSFSNGLWAGNVTVPAPTTNMVLRAADGSGHVGSSNPFAVELRNDIAVSVQDAPDPVSLGGPITYAINVTNIGPAAATGVVLTNILSSGVSFVSATTSQGSAQVFGKTVVCYLLDLSSNTSATVTIVATATNIGTLTNRTTVVRADADSYLTNNSVVNFTTVQVPALTINDVSRYEGNAGMANAVFTVSLSPAPASPVTVNFATGNSSAESPGDFIATNGVLNFAIGETNRSFAVRVVGDTAYELDETFTVNLFTPVNATLADSQAVGTIRNDDAMPTMSIGDAVLLEGNTGTTNAVFAVTLSTASGLNTTFNYATVDSSAVSGSDYTAQSGVLTIPAGNTSTYIVISVNGDLQIESDEVFYLDLSAPVNAMLMKREGVGFIINDDGLPGDADHFVWSPIATQQYVNHPFDVTITALDAFNNPAVNFTGPAFLSAATGFGATNVLGTATDTVSFPIYTGYYAERTQVIYPAAELGGAGRISAIALDIASLPGIALNNWTIRLKPTALTNYNSYLWESTNWTVVYQTNLSIAANGWAIFNFDTPFDYDGTNSLMIDFSFYNSTTYGSGASRSTARSQTRSLYYYSSSYGNPLTWSGSSPFPYATTYTPNLQLLRVPGQIIPIQPALTGVFSNGVWAGSLTALELATNVWLRVDDGNGHIGYGDNFAVSWYDDVGISVSDGPDPVAVGAALTYTISVTNSGPSVATGVFVTNTLPPGVTLLAVTSGQGSVSTNGQLLICDLGNIAAGNQTTVAVTVSSALSGALTNVATVTRTGPDNYAANNVATNITTVVMPALSINDAGTMELLGGPTNLQFSVILSVASPQSITVNYATANGTALADSDYVTTNGVLNFEPGQTNQIINVQILDDGTSEPNEIFSVILSGPVNASVAKASGIGIIFDNDGPPEFKITALLTSNSKVVDHDSLTGDDRGGIAISTSQVFVTGDNATARFAASDLTSGIGLGFVRDSLCTDLRTETVYLLGNGATPLTSSGGTVTTLIELNPVTGAPSGVVISLSQSFTMVSGSGIFSGNGRIVIHNGTTVYDIYVPTGTVTSRGAMATPNWYPSESWAIWGVAEYFDGILYLTYRENGTSRIVRARVPDGQVTVVATFSNLSEMASLVVSPSRNRWYFHHEYGSQFGGSSETLGYADALFAYVSSNPPAILDQPVSQAVMLGGTANFNVTVSGSVPLSYQWRFYNTNLPGQTTAALTLANVQSNQVGPYSVFVANAFGAVTSTIVTLTVLPPGSGVAYLRSSVGVPWGYSSNESALNRVFGAGNWQDLRFETAVTGTLFSPGNGFIFMDGSDSGAAEMETFVNANRTLMETWVANGGRLFLNSAPNEDNGMYFGFGVNLIYPDHTSEGRVALPAHPVFNGPFLPAGTNWTGNYFGHATITGTNLTALITNTANGRFVLAEQTYGMGRVLFGGMTTHNFHTPATEAANLRANIIYYGNTPVLVTNQPPVITAQPTNQTVMVGAAVVFNVTVTGSAPLVYQWQKGTSPLSNETNATLTLQNVQPNDAGFYSVVISNSVGSVTSSNAMLTVLTLPPGISSQPASLTVAVGSSATFSVIASGSQPLWYQWRRDNGAIFGATNSSYTMNPVQYVNAGSYSVVISNAYGFTNSAPATLTVVSYQTNISISTLDKGWYDATGMHSPSNPNYLCGDYAGSSSSPYRNWFVFNLPAVLPGPVLAAQLRLKTYNITSPTGSETYQLRHVSTAVAALMAGGSGLISIYNDLADGTVYGSRSFSTTETNQFITMDLNADCITNLIAAAGQPFAIGGAITSLDGTLTNNETIFAGSSGPSNDVQLIITFGDVADQRLKLLPPESVAGRLRLFVTTVDGSPIAAGRASNIWVYAATNVTVPLSNWTALAIAPVLTNGQLLVAGINPTNLPALFFRAIEGSWNVRPLWLHPPQFSGTDLIIQAGNGDGSPLTPIRAAKIRFYSTTNVTLPFSVWTPLASPPILSNGLLQISSPALTNSPAIYFRAEEIP